MNQQDYLDDELHMQRDCWKSGVVLCVSAIISRVSEERNPVYRPDIDSTEIKVNPLLITMMTDCWAEDPSNRLGFDEILKLIRKLNGGK